MDTHAPPPPPPPDEPTKEILSPALKVSDEVFSSTSGTSPFAGYSPSTSALLVVCKTWLRIATPLLYHVVVLRSKAQAQALEGVLRENQLLGTFIKKLRLEGGFGSAMYPIIMAAPNLTDLFLPFDIWSADSVSGLCRGLPKMNPTRVILNDKDSTDPDKFSNAPLRQLVKALCECLKSWTKLKIFDFPYLGIVRPLPNRIRAISEALSETPNLKTIILREAQPFPAFLPILARNPSLQAVRVPVVRDLHPYYRGQVAAFKAEVRKDNRLRALVHFVSLPLEQEPEEELSAAQSVQTITASNPTFVPLGSSPTDVKRKVWDRVIHFVMLIVQETVFEHQFFDPKDPYRTNKLQGAGRHLLTVSKLFHELAISHFYKCVAISSNTALTNFAGRLSEDNSLGPRVLYLFTAVWAEPTGTADLRTVLSYTTSLKRLVSIASRRFLSPGGEDEAQRAVLDFRGLATLGSAAGSTLVELSGQGITRPGGPQSPAPLYALSELRTLEWQSAAKFKFKSAEVPVGALAKLENLTYSSINDSFLTLLGCMELPALRHLSFPSVAKMEGADSFLKKHGSKLLSLEIKSVGRIFDLCPNLTLLVILGNPLAGYFKCTTPHMALKKIFIPRYATDGQVKAFFSYLGEVDWSVFPTLEKVQVLSCKWPLDERGIRKGPGSHWVSWAEHLLKWNVRLTDSNAKHWKPRLKVT